MVPLQRLFRSSMSYAFLSLEFTADVCLLKLIYLENKVLHALRNLEGVQG